MFNHSHIRHFSSVFVSLRDFELITQNSSENITSRQSRCIYVNGGGEWEWVAITDLKNMADYIALQYFVFLQKDLATFTTNEGWSFLISGTWPTIGSSKHLRHPKRREIRRKRLPQDS